LNTELCIISQLEKLFYIIISLPITLLNAFYFLFRNELSDEQENSLKSLMDFIDSNMWTSSKEKRALAMKLCVKIVAIVPADIIPVVVSPQMIQSILSSRAKKTNVLFGYTGSVLEELVAAVGQEKNDRLLALITILTHTGGAGNFDSRTQTTTLQNLVKTMDSNTILDYFHLLCGMIGKQIEIPQQVTYKEDEENDNDEMEVDEDEQKKGKEESITALHHPSIDALNSMMALSKHSNLTDPNLLLLPIATILIRLSSFKAGKTNNTTSATGKKDKKKDKKDKKNSKKDEEEAAPLGEKNEMIEKSIQSVQIIEKTLFEESKNTEIPEEIVSFAKEHVMSFLNASLHKLSTLSHPHQQNRKKEEDAEQQQSSSGSSSNKTTEFLQNLWTVIGNFFQSSLKSSQQSNAANDDKMEEEEEVEHLSVAVVYKQMDEILSHFFAFFTTKKELLQKEKKKYSFLKYLENSSILLMIIFLSQLLGNELEHEIILELPNLLMSFFTNSLSGLTGGEKKKSSNEDDDEQSEEDPFEVRLLDICMDLLAVQNENSLKGIRDVIKRLWNNIFLIMEEEAISQTFYDVLMDSVVQFEDTASAEQEGEEADEEDDEENDDEEEEEDEPEQKSNKKRKLDNKKKSQKRHAEEEEEEEDIVINEEDMLDLLLTEEDGDDILMKMREGHLPEQQHHDHDDDDADLDEEEKATLLHFEAADDALVKMMKARQESRKKGLMNMKKQQLLLKSRVLDILEVVINRSKSSFILFSFLTPLLKGYIKCVTSNLIQDLPEGKSFTQRLHQVIINELCKKKLTLSFEQTDNDDNNELESEFFEEMKELVVLFEKKLLNSKVSALKSVGYESFYWLLKIALSTSPHLSSDSKRKELSSLIVEDCVLKSLNHFYFKKSHSSSSMQAAQMTIKFFEELFIHRFPSFFLYYKNSSSAEEMKEEKKSKGDKKTPRKSVSATGSSSEKEDYLIWKSLNDGFLKTNSFTKKLQIVELVNNTFIKLFQTFDSSKNTETVKVDKKKKQKEEQKPKTNTANSNSSSQQNDLKVYLLTDFLPNYFSSFDEIMKSVLTSAKEKHLSTEEATEASQQKTKKDFDTKNLRAFMNSLFSLLNWSLSFIEQNSDKQLANELKTSIQMAIHLLIKSFQDLQEIYDKVNARNKAAVVTSEDKDNKQSKKRPLSKSNSNAANVISPVVYQSVEDIIGIIREMVIADFQPTTTQQAPQSSKKNSVNESAVKEKTQKKKV
jgi:hypothetical protein